MTFKTVDPSGNPAGELHADCNLDGAAFVFKFEYEKKEIEFRMEKPIASDFWLAVDEVLSGSKSHMGRG